MKTFKDFAKNIGLNEQQLNNIVNFSDKFYNTYYKRKNVKATKRIIDAPNAQLKAIQRWLLKNILENIKINSRANGFIKGRSIKRNAKYHLKKKYILCMDIKDFFPSIKQSRIYETLKKVIDDSELAYKISKVCTYKRYLPQGAPTSPIISNIIFRDIDEEIANLCNRNLITYSRYADDLSFSSDNRQKLINIIIPLTKIVNKYGFWINTKKTRLYSGKNRMTVTGIILNSGTLTVGREIKRNVRSNLFNLIIKGDKKINKKKLIGYICFIRDIEPEYYKKIIKYKDRLIEIRNK